MITYSRLGYRGNLGNQLFQIASLISLSKKHNQNYCIPKWKYAECFDFEFNIGYADQSFIEIKEKKFEFHDWEINSGNFDLDGWLQTEKYFDKHLIKNIFEFNQDLKNEVLLKNKYLFKNSILISVRRGDFVFNPSFYQLDFYYYFKALVHYFPDYKDHNLIFASDDMSYCKSLFQFLPNAYFLDKHSPIEQLIIASECQNFIISNSTFSWWMAWFGEKENSKIIRPLKNFSEETAKKLNDKDFFPERWISFDDRKFTLSNQFVILKIRGFFYQVFSRINYQYYQHLRICKDFVKKLIK